MKYKVPHILIIRLSAMGDVAMSVPVLKALTKQHPTVKITVISRAVFEPLFKDIDRITFFSVALDEHKGLWGLYRLYKTLSCLKITHIADLHNVLRTKIIKFFFSFNAVFIAQIDKGRAEKKALTRFKNKRFKPLKTTPQRYAEVFEKLGFPLDLSSVKPIVKPQLLPEVLSLSGAKRQLWIGIAPFAAFTCKIYPLDLMEQVIARLSKQDYTLFLFGSKQEMPALVQLDKKYKNTICVAGKLSGLTEELNLIANLDIMLAMDSGNAHLSAIHDVKTITLWGATHPYAGFVPFNQPLDFCMLPNRKKFPNLPYTIYGTNKVYKGYENVMRNITPKQIIQKIQHLLTE